jgi:hypothetical protein
MSPLDVLQSDVRGQSSNALRFNKRALGEISRLSEEEVCTNARRQVETGIDWDPARIRTEVEEANAKHCSRSAGERITISHARQDLLISETQIANVLEESVRSTFSKRSEIGVWANLVLEGA